ncbi:unnamed protein product [Acanthoscelides obtectus]|uniref:Uncharacterized protein n=1 Tax=Acanthoscelides obtectus TaxID=200917 RepID=A0A9P0KEH1_ACAOB|nr:unnamed protein product [Acanthoscelides obtectus]CAK1635707.1 hypothetical protein AOBTE_LOCUS9453 [Acanthoscelides obtectus]
MDQNYLNFLKKGLKRHHEKIDILFTSINYKLQLAINQLQVAGEIKVKLAKTYVPYPVEPLGGCLVAGGGLHGLEGAGLLKPDPDLLPIFIHIRMYKTKNTAPVIIATIIIKQINVQTQLILKISKY